ncbi:MAG: rRNA maturation RNase YbeY [Actinomycetota bacterium]
MSSDDPHHPVPLVLFDNRQERPVDEDALADLARTTMTGEGVAGGELSVSFVTPEEIEELHVRYMGEPGPTDVLSFPQDDDIATVDRGSSPALLGDVVICPAEAEDNNPHDVEGELRLLLVHGILHLLGYDHEEDAERAQMWARQEHYVGRAS